MPWNAVANAGVFALATMTAVYAGGYFDDQRQP
jgi:hypothetical protein